MIQVIYSSDGNIIMTKKHYFISALKSFLINFSVYTNTKKLFDTALPKSGSHIECLDGIRFLSISWVVLGHCVGNVTDFFAISNQRFKPRVI